MSPLTLAQRSLLLPGGFPSIGTVTRFGVKTSDSFDRANSALTMGTTDCVFGGDPLAWAPLAGTWGINTNLAYCATSTDQGCTAVDTGLANVIIDCTFTAVGADSGLIYRAVDNSNYFVWTSGGAVYRHQGGGFAQVGTMSALADGNVATVKLTGNTHSFFVDASFATSFTDAFQASATKHGIRASSDTAARFNNFKVTIN